MHGEKEILTEELNPTFLFTWKGTRTCDEKNYHSHENQIEMGFILSGKGKYRIDDEIYTVEEGDLLIINPGMYHQYEVVRDMDDFKSRIDNLTIEESIVSFDINLKADFLILLKELFQV